MWCVPFSCPSDTRGTSSANMNVQRYRAASRELREKHGGPAVVARQLPRTVGCDSDKTQDT